MNISTLLIRIFSGILGLIFSVITVFGVLGTIKVPSYLTVGLGIIILGAVGLIVCFAGCCGAGYEKKDVEKEKMKVKGFFLVVYFSVISVLHIAFVIFGVACICMHSSVALIGSLPSEDVIVIEKGLGLENNLEGVVEVLSKCLLATGIVFVSTSFIILISMIITSYNMGFAIFKFYIPTASVVQLIIGLALAVFLLVENGNIVKYLKEFPNGIFESLIASGFVLACVGILGFISACCGNQFRWISALYTIFNVIILLGFCGVLVVTIVYHTNIENIIETYCEGEGEEDCADRNDNIINNYGYCLSDPSHCPEHENDYLNESIEWSRSWIILLMFISIYLIVLLVIVMVATFINCFKKPIDKSDSYNKFSGYSYY